MESAVKQWLAENDLGELEESFLRHKITCMRRVRRLNGALIEKLTDEVGLQADLLYLVNELNNEDEAKNSQQEPVVIQKETPTVFGLDPLAESFILSEDLPCVEITDESGQHVEVLKVQSVGESDSGFEYDQEIQSTSTASEPSQKRRKTQTLSNSTSKYILASKGEDYIRSLDFKRLLAQDINGTAALEHFEEEGCLTTTDRSHIILLAAKELLKFNPNPGRVEYREITQKIVEVFTPAEIAETYFNESTVVPSGKLPHKVKNIKYSLGKHAQSKPEHSSRASAVPSIETGSVSRHTGGFDVPAKLYGSTDPECREITEACSQLRNQDTESLKEVLKSWSATHSLRFKYLRSTRPTSTRQGTSTASHDPLVGEYLTKWPILLSKNGHKLIRQDFGELYPNKAEGLTKKWDSRKGLIATLSSKECSKNDAYTKEILNSLKDISEDQKDVTILFLLPSLLCKRGRGKQRSCAPSVVESAKAAFLHVKVANDIDREIRNQRALLKNQGDRTQPFVVFVGATLSSITASYVQIDQKRFIQTTPLSAVDLCFKAFHALDAAYPNACAAVWLFIQKYFYELNLKEDPSIVRVGEIICSLEGLRSKLNIQ